MTKPKSPTNETNDKELEDILFSFTIARYNRRAPKHSPNASEELASVLKKREQKLELRARLEEAYEAVGTSYVNLPTYLVNRLSSLEQQLKELEQSNE